MNKGTRTQPVRKKLLNKTPCIAGSIAFIVMLIIIAAAPVIAFDANAIWLKGTVRIEKYKLLDPRINIDEFQIGKDEEVTLYVTYRAAARDDIERGCKRYLSRKNNNSGSCFRRKKITRETKIYLK